MQTHSKWQSLSQSTYIWPLYSSFHCIPLLVTKKCPQWHQCNADLVLPYKFNLRKFLKVNPILTLNMWGSHRCEAHACSYMTKLRKKENPHQTCLCYTPGVDSMSSYSVSVTYTISGHITSFCRGGDNTNIQATFATTELTGTHSGGPDWALVIFSGTNPAAWCVTSIIRVFFLPALMLCHLRVPAEWIRAACQLSVPVWAHRIAWAHGVLALLLLAESWALVSGSASPWHTTDVGLPSPRCSWAA